MRHESCDGCLYDLGGGRDNCMLNVAYECRDGGGFEAWTAKEHGQREVRHIMRNKITLGSLFDGSGGFPLAGCMCGIEPLWASEIEPYPIAVTKARFPRMKHFGDVQKISGAEVDPVDVITFGSPCQDMSIAGKRAGLRHEENGDDHTTRSGLFIEAIRIIREMRQATNGKYPAFAVWENVPGAFSSNGGADFKTVLEELASVAQGEHVSVPFPEKRKWLNAGEIVGDGFSIAWRVLDAQYWGVPQRRKRIYLVADFAGGRAGKILFEREGGGGNPESGEEARQGAADHAAGGAGGSDRVECFTNRGYPCGDVAETCRAGSHGSIPMIAGFMGGHGTKAGGLGYAEEIAPTIKSVLSGGNTIPDVVYALQGNGIDRALTAGCNGAGWRQDVSYTLNTIDRHSVVYPEVARTLTAEHDSSPCVDRGQNVVAIDCRNLNANIEISGTLQAKTNGGQSLNYQNPVVYEPRSMLAENWAESEAKNALRAGESKSAHAVVYSSGSFGTLSEGVGCLGTGTSYTALCVGNGQLHNISMAEQMNTLDCMHDQQAVLVNGKPPRRYVVRRLTPLECCRLQGFPDGWGDIPLLEIMTDADAKFWEDVRRTYAGAIGKKYRPFKDKDALLKWYNKLHTDSAEYKMWGNGIALQCAVFVLSGIADAISKM